MPVGIEKAISENKNVDVPPSLGMLAARARNKIERGRRRENKGLWGVAGGALTCGVCWLLFTPLGAALTLSSVVFGAGAFLAALGIGMCEEGDKLRNSGERDLVSVAAERKRRLVIASQSALEWLKAGRLRLGAETIVLAAEEEPKSLRVERWRMDEERLLDRLGKPVCQLFVSVQLYEAMLQKDGSIARKEKVKNIPGFTIRLLVPAGKSGCRVSTAEERVEEKCGAASVPAFSPAGSMDSLQRDARQVTGVAADDFRGKRRAAFSGAVMRGAR